MHNPPPSELIDALRGASGVVLTSHRNPDGDAIGSEVGMVHLLRACGKRTLVWNRDPAPTVCRPLLENVRLHVGPEPPEAWGEGLFDTVVVLECPTLERTGLENRLESSRLLNVDHHLGNTLYGAVNWVDTEAAAVGELVLRLATALGVELEPAAATALYLALVSDTGNFRFSNTSPRALRAAADLVALGASPVEVSEWLYESLPLATLRLTARMIGGMVIGAGGRLATAALSQAMFDEAGAAEGHAEGLIDHLRSVAGVDTVALLKELEPARSKASLRSRPGGIDVERIASHFGGGGHRYAAGCQLDLPLEEALQTIRDALGAALEETS